MARSEERWEIARLAHRAVSLTLACDEAGALVAVSIGGEEAGVQSHAARFGATVVDEAGAAARAGLEAAQAQLAAYLEGRLQRFDLPLRPLGTEFQRRAWAALQTIPYGATWSYGEQAAALGAPKASRAVGAANGRNPLPIVIPCHRVIGGDGSLTGFGGGLAVKRWLLALERAPGFADLWERG